MGANWGCVFDHFLYTKGFGIDWCCAAIITLVYASIPC